MYRHNQLKEELDKLRDENDYFKLQIRYLNEKCARRDLEIRNLQLQLKIKDMSIQLLYSVKPQPMDIKVDVDAMHPELFKAGFDTSMLKDKQVYTASEIVNNNELFRKMCRNMGIPDDIIDEMLDNKKGKSE